MLADRTATSHVKVAWPLAFLFNRFQVAWINAAARIRVRAQALTGKST
jgi:hypothetical protein